MMTHLSKKLILCLLAVFIFQPAFSGRALHAEPALANLAQPTVDDDHLACDESPFGDKLPFLVENELFVPTTKGFSVWDFDGSDLTGLFTNPSPQEIDSSIAVNLSRNGQSQNVQAKVDGNGSITVFVYGRNSAGNPILLNSWNSRTDGGIADSFRNTQVVSAQTTKFFGGNELLLLGESVNNFNQVMLLINGSVSEDGVTLWMDESVRRDFHITYDFAEAVRLISADTDGDGFDEQIVISKHGGNDFLIEVRDRRGMRKQIFKFDTDLKNNFGPASIDTLDFSVAAGNVQGDLRDELVLTLFSNQSSRVVAFQMPLPTEPSLRDLTNDSFDLVEPIIDVPDMPLVNFGDAAGTDLYNLGNDPYDELLFVESDRLTVWDINSNGGSKAQYSNLPNYNSDVTSASVAGGKMQLGGLPGIAVAFNYPNSIALSYFEAEYDVNGKLSLVLKSADTFNQGEGGSNFSPVSFGDWDHDTLYAELSTDDTDCSAVTDYPITTVAWWPAFWGALQGDSVKAVKVGNVSIEGEGAEKTQTTVSSHDISGYVGVKAGANIPFGPSVSAEAKVTAGANFERSNGYTSANESITQFAIEQEVDSSDPEFEQAWGLIQGATAELDCFVYKVPAGNPEFEGVVKLCRLTKSTPSSGTISGHQEQSVLDRTRQWANVQRDWANLALFKTTEQSSTVPDRSPHHAIDMNMVHESHTPNIVPYAGTYIEDNPWWQVDLGEMQSISDVRLWIRPLLNQSANTLVYPENIYIFVSPVPFGNKTFAQLLDDPKVTYVSQEKVGKVANFNLRREYYEPDPDPKAPRIFNPIAGRYVRVQLAGNGRLALDEVQIFGDTHIDPDRYPTSVSDETPHDGWHTVTLYDPFSNQLKEMPARGDINIDELKTNGGTSWSEISWNGTPKTSWELSNEQNHSTIKFNGSAHSQRIGAEVNVEAGPVVAGGAYEFGSGLSTENATSTSWGTGFSLGGSLAGISSTKYSSEVRAQCNYKTSPYSYTLIEPTDSGYKHNVMVVDYTAFPLNRNTLASCVDAPTFDSDNDGIEDGADAEPYKVNVPLFEFAQDEYSFSESAGSPQITVKLDELVGGPASVTVKALILSTSAYNAQVGPGKDTTFSEQMLTFNSPGSQTVSLPLVNDNEFELDERLYLRLAYSSGGGTVITDQVTIIITDDDAADLPLGQPGQSLFFNGDYVTMDKNLDIGETSHTVEMWVKVPVVGTLGLEENERPGIILGNLTSSQDLSGFDGRSSWDIISNGRPRVFWGFDNHQSAVADFFLIGQTDLRDGNWHHLAFVRDKTADTYAIYVDGVKEAEHDGAGKDMDWVTDDILGTARLRIGSDYRVSERDASFHGEIDELRIWSTPLNATSIRSLANIDAEFDSGAIGRLVTYFPFNEGSGVWARNLVTQGSGRLGVSNLFLPTWTNNIAVEPAVQLTVGEMAVSESAGSAEVEIKLAREVEQPIEVTVATTPGTANSPADFGAVSETVTIPAGSRSQMVSVPIVADATEETNEQFTLTLTSADATVYGNKLVEVTIEDDDGDPLTVSAVGSKNLNIANGEGSADREVGYLLQLSKAVNQSVTVNVSVASGTTAVSGAEFSVPTTVTFAPNERVASLPVSILAAAGGKQKVIRLTLTSSSATVSDQTLTVNLLDGSGSSGNTIFLPLVVR